MGQENKQIKIRSSQMLQTTNQYVEQLSNFAKATEVEFTPYGKECVVNAFRTIDPMLLIQGYTWSSFSANNIVSVMQQVAFFEVNSAASPRECFFIIRKNKDRQGNIVPTLEFGIEGAGNDVILNKFGRDVVKTTFHIVYKEDKFTPGYVDGWDIVLPKYERTFKTNIPEKVYYLIKKTDGETDVQYADVSDVKKSLLASAKQNGADETLLREMNKLGLYEILEDEKWLNMKVKNAWGKESKLLNPSYTSPVSQQNMIERKLRNHATRKYPKNFNNSILEEIYENSFEDRTEDLKEVERIVNPKEAITNSNEEVSINANRKELIIDDKRPTLEVVDEETGVVTQEPQESNKPQEEIKENSKEKERTIWDD